MPSVTSRPAPAAAAAPRAVFRRRSGCGGPEVVVVSDRLGKGPSRTRRRASDLHMAVGVESGHRKKPLKKTAARRKLNLTYVFLLVKGRETAFQDSPRSR